MSGGAKTTPRLHPLSFSQEQLWFLERMNPGTPLYNVPQALRLDGPLDAEALERSLAEIVRRHDALRTNFRTVAGRPVQVVSPPGDWRLTRVDLSGLPEAGREEEALRLMAEEAAKPFDLERDSLFRAILASIGPLSHFLLLCLHHIVSDGWSVMVIFEELSALYPAFAGGRAPGSPVLAGVAAQFSDHAAWQREWLTTAAARDDLEHWRTKLAGLPPLLELPADRPRPSVQSFRGDTIERALPRELTARLRAFCRQSGATLFPALLTVYDILLQRYTGRRDIVLGTPVASRTRKESQGVVGFLVNMVVLRSDVDGGRSFADLVKAIGQDALEALSRQGIPLEMVVDAVAPERSPSYNPLFQVAFAVQEPVETYLKLPGISAAMVPITTGTSKFDLTVTAHDAPPDVTLVAEYASDLFDRETVARLLSHYETILAAALAEPERAVATLPILPVAERHQVTTGWNAGPAGRAVPPGRLAHEIFEAAASRSPGSPAVTFEGTTLTYRQLDEWADRVSGELVALGAEPEGIVAICLDRSPAMVAAVLGVLKSGAAYLPLDPAYPAERVGYMLQTAGARLVLTQRSLAGRLENLHAPSLRLLLMDDDGPNGLGWARPEAAGNGSGPAGKSVAQGKSRASGKGAARPSPAAKRALPGNLAYVMFTSGSTGQPKGVMIEHQALSNMAEAIDYAFGLGPEARVLQFASLSFDVSIFEMVATWRAGATLCLGRRESLMSGPELARLLREESITTLIVPPTALATLPTGDYPSLSVVVAAGEACPPDAVDNWAPGRRFWNLYGPTEITVWATVAECSPGKGRPPIGPPVGGATAYLLDSAGDPVPIGVPGELYVGGAGVARGYFARPDLTAERFVPDPFGGQPGTRLYRTGDVARWLPNGSVDYLGRADQQIKLRGFRIELGEIEAVLGSHAAVREAAVIVREDTPGDRRLVAYVSTGRGGGDPELEVALRDLLRSRLPEYMIPSTIVVLDALPLTPNRKIDRRALPAPLGLRPAQKAEFVAPRTETEKTIAAVWQDVLRLEKVGVYDNFFDLGGNSILLARTGLELRRPFGREIRVVDLLRHATISSLAAYLDETSAEAATASAEAATACAEAATASTQAAAASVKAAGPAKAAAPAVPPLPDKAVAIVGLAGRFPGAGTVEDFWRNLCQGVESISFFTEEELAEAGVPRAMLEDPHYVRAAGALEGVDLFDAPFFGYTPREAAVMDPQQRLFLETAWAALEDAGYSPDAIEVPVGVFAGEGLPSYLADLGSFSRPEGRGEGDLGDLEAVIGNDKDFLTTRVAYKLGLTGPAVTVQTACSTSLVAVHLARRSLLAGDCYMALAGGVRVHVFGKSGYLYQEGGVASPDGHCRAFDSGARGAVPGDGVAVVVLKRLSDAIRDGDTIRAVIRGSAINNDGSSKPGFTAPSIDAQARVVAAALAEAEVEPGTIGFVETHGTGTALGDPIEVEALTQAYGPGLPPRSCALASLKTNVGHLDAAAGIAGLIKAALCLERGLIPPSLNFRSPNPAIDFGASPFYVNTELAEWKPVGHPRRAGVSSFGIGGTNVHIVLEAPPAGAAAGESAASAPCGEIASGAAAGPPPGELFVFSARSEWSLEAARKAFAALADATVPASAPTFAPLFAPGASSADVAYTLQTGRSAFSYRLAVAARSAEDAFRALAARDPERLFYGRVEDANRPVAFLFPGQGTQYPGMGRGLYDAFPIFRQEVDTCSELLRPTLGLDLRDLIYPAACGEAEAACLERTEFAQPALFTIEWALAKLLLAWGFSPRAMVGHSVGEYVAAALAGVFTLEDALGLVAARGRLTQAAPTGAMLAVPLPENEVTRHLKSELALAAVNAPDMCTVSGPAEMIEALSLTLAARGVECRRLHTSHAFHSPMLDPVKDEFGRAVAKARLREPALPYLSDVTGDWITSAQATDPAYWVEHLRRTVRFGDAAKRVLEIPGIVFIEVGPGRTLGTLVKRQRATPEPTAISAMRHPSGSEEDDLFLLSALGRAWVSGVKLDWRAMRGGSPRRRVPLPTYRFEPRRYWLSSGVGRAKSPSQAASATRVLGASARGGLVVAGEPAAYGARSAGEPAAHPAPSPSAPTAFEAAGAAPEPAALQAAATALPDGRQGLATRFVAPRNDQEEIIAGLWRELMGLPEVGVFDDFTDLGGHSLLATQIIARLRQVFDVDVPLARFYEKPTVAGLAETVEDLLIAKLEATS